MKRLNVFSRRLHSLAWLSVIVFPVCTSLTDATITSTSFATVQISPWQSHSWGVEVAGHAKVQWMKRLLSLSPGPETYMLQYSYLADPTDPGWFAPMPEGYIGMSGPVWENWYGNGFLYIIVNGQDLGLTKVTSIRKMEEGDRGSVQMLWERDDAQVRVTFLVLSGDPTLYAEIAVLPKTTFRSLSLRLVAYPSAYTSQGDRWVVTPSRAIQQVTKTDLMVEKDRWLVYEDRKVGKGAGTAYGGCGLLFLPEEVQSGILEVTVYPIITCLDAKSGVPRVRLALWDFHAKTNAEAESFMRANADSTTRRLREIDFRTQHLRPEVWSKQMSEILQILELATDKPALGEQVKGLLREIDEAHAQLARLIAEGQPVAPGLEDSILQNIDKLAPLLWELRFVKLFSEK